MAPGLVPRSVLSAPEKARRKVALIVGAATGAAALAGLWIRVEDGLEFRLVLAATSALLGWLTIEVALAARDAWSASLRAFGISIVAGAMNTVFPTFILCVREPVEVTPVFCVPFGAVLGVFTGFVYGIVLAVVAAATWDHVASGTHDGADRALRVASAWAVLPLALIALVVVGYDLPKPLHEWSSEREIAMHQIAVPFGVLALGIVFNVALWSCHAASRRAVRRARWLAHVASGADPRWSVREIEPYEDVDGLPRLRQGTMVLEHHDEHAIYRASATGERVAII